MKEALRLTVILTLICLLSGALLAWVSTLTAAPIEAARKAEKNDALRTVLPEFDNQPSQDTLPINEGGKSWTFYLAKKSGAVVGAAFEATSEHGYGGKIDVLVGIDADGKVYGFDVLQQHETPGLGAKIDQPDFKGLFRGLDLRATRWAVRKDGGDLQEITAATISSRAVVEAIKEGTAVYLAHEAELRGK